MLEQDNTAKIREAIEEELGRLRFVAHLPATDLEEIAARLTRAVAPLIGVATVKGRAA